MEKYNKLKHKQTKEDLQEEHKKEQSKKYEKN